MTARAVLYWPATAVKSRFRLRTRQALRRLTGPSSLEPALDAQSRVRVFHGEKGRPAPKVPTVGRSLARHRARLLDVDAVPVQENFEVSHNGGPRVRVAQRAAPDLQVEGLLVRAKGLRRKGRRRGALTESPGKVPETQRR